MTARTAGRGRTNQPNRGPVTRAAANGASDAAPAEARADTPLAAAAKASARQMTEAVAGSVPAGRYRRATAGVMAQGGGGKWLSGWFICLLVSWIHLGLLNYLNYSLTDAPLATAGPLSIAGLAVPAVVTAFRVPQSRLGIWRWLVLWLLIGLTAGQATQIVLLAGETVLLHRAWVSQRRYGFEWTPAPGFEADLKPTAVRRAGQRLFGRTDR